MPIFSREAMCATVAPMMTLTGFIRKFWSGFKPLFVGSIVFLVFFRPSYAQDLTVAAAGNVQYPLEELRTEFEKEARLTVKTVIGSSGNLTTQIENGAPFDVFISADMDYPRALAKKGLTHAPPRIYAYGKLVLWTLKDLDLTQGLEVLKSPLVKKVAIASPQSAPYGRQAVNAFKYFNLYSDLEGKLVYGESIAQVNQFIETQAADAGITAWSVVLSPKMRQKGKWIEVAPQAYEPIAQGAVILQHAKSGNFKEAKAFYDFLFSAKAKTILERYGYRTHE